MFNISEWVSPCVLELPLAWLAVSLFSFLTPAPTTTTHQDGLDDEDVHAGEITDWSLVMLVIISQYLQSMPKMPEAEKKEESAESLAEKKEQVCWG